MAILENADALTKREQLVRDGYCVIPSVLKGDLLERLRVYTNDLLDRHVVDPNVRYQGSDFHVNTERRFRSGNVERPDLALWSPIADELVDLREAIEACDLLGLEGRHADDTMLILNKPPHGPALYWHQDFMEWNHPQASLPWPTRVFLSYYLVDTTEENGCLRAIPGTHLRRIPLHDILPAAHGPEIQALNTDHPAFADHPDAVDLPVKAGDLVINDARVLHAAYANGTDHRRPLILQWHSIFPWPSVPTWWTGPIPEVIKNAQRYGEYELSRIPREYLATH